MQIARHSSALPIRRQSRPIVSNEAPVCPDGQMRSLWWSGPRSCVAALRLFFCNLLQAVARRCDAAVGHWNHWKIRLAFRLRGLDPAGRMNAGRTIFRNRLSIWRVISSLARSVTILLDLDDGSFGCSIDPWSDEQPHTLVVLQRLADCRQVFLADELRDRYRERRTVQ